MPPWINDRLPTRQDGDLHGKVLLLWGKPPGLPIPWQDIKPHEWWRHSSPPMAQLDALMAKMPEQWRKRWCRSGACACMGCANISGGLTREGYTEADHQKWIKWKS